MRRSPAGPAGGHSTWRSAGQRARVVEASVWGTGASARHSTCVGPGATRTRRDARGGPHNTDRQGGPHRKSSAPRRVGRLVPPPSPRVAPRAAQTGHERGHSLTQGPARHGGEQTRRRGRPPHALSGTLFSTRKQGILGAKRKCHGVHDQWDLGCACTLVRLHVGLQGRPTDMTSESERPGRKGERRGEERRGEKGRGEGR